MNLHEYQGKDLFAKFGLPVSKNRVITSADDVVNACKIGRAHVRTPVTSLSRMPSSA